jgi:hypothetical protein
MAFNMDDIVLKDNVISTGLKILDKVITDPSQKDAAKLSFLNLQQQGEFKDLGATPQPQQQSDTAQVEIDKIEAQSPSFFISGWRPAAGWVCVLGLFYQLIFRPIFGWTMTNFAGWGMPPALETETLMTLLFGMLGLGGFRMAEKMKGVAR